MKRLYIFMKRLYKGFKITKNFFHILIVNYFDTFLNY